ncbi:DEAD/DEAH box helicase [Myxococcota bacterium]
MTGPLKLRDYQRDCLDIIWEQYQSGVRRQLVCLPTGTGKTVIFAQFPRFFRMQKRMLVLAHREELLTQARDKILRANPELRVEIEKANRKASPDCDVVVASVPTLGRKRSARIEKLDIEDFYLIVVDEAHHATAATYRRVLERFELFADDTRRLLVGFTATPKRGDGEGLDAVFQSIVFSHTLPEMVDAGFLAPVAGFRVETAVDLSGVRTRMGDFVTSQLSRAVNVRGRNDLVVKIFQDMLGDRQTLVFCVDVAHAKSLAQSFGDAGVRVAAVTGEMEQESRRQALADFSAGNIQVLTNCMVLTEGYDESSISGIILARPTRSSLLYTQMIGRGTRLHPGKQEVTIVDVVDVTRDKKLATLPGLFGLSTTFDLEGHTTQKVQEALEWVEGNRPWVRADLATSLSDLRYRCRRLNLLDLQLPEELMGHAAFAWTAVGRDTYRLGLGKGESLIVGSTILGRWEVTWRAWGESRTIGMAKDGRDAIARAEQFVARERPGAVRLVRRDVRWRRGPASDKQLKLLESKGIETPKGLTKGQASHLIAMISRERK